MPGGECVFNPLWLEREDFTDWLECRPQNKHKAYCKLCRKEIDISNMGESALKSHMSSKKHISIRETKNTSNLTNFFQVSASSSQSEQSVANSASVDTIGSLQNNSNVISSNAACSSKSGFSVKKEVQEAEIIWALKSMKSHYSYKSAEDISKIFKSMFPDSQIASEFSCGEKKLAYICGFGIAPHFQKLLSKSLEECEYYTLMFDETLNDMRQEKQMDIHVRFWNLDLNEVCTRYYTSVFMGHATAKDILNAFHSTTKDLPLNKVIQISMDGPAVNWAFYEMLETEMMEKYGTNFINIGSCGLHTINNAFKNGESKTEWDISSILSSLYYLFNDSPARRDDFLKFSKTKKFPQKFVRHRWLENVPAAERALEIWGDVQTYVENVNKRTFAKPRNKSFSIISEAIKDILMPVKIAFFVSVSKLLLPFMTIYQSDKPLLPFFASDLLNLFIDCLNSFNLVKSEVVKNFSFAKLYNFDFRNKSNLSAINAITVGFLGDKLLRQMKQESKINEGEILDFKHKCQIFVLTMLEDIIKKSPLNYGIVRNIICLDPKIMVQKKLKCVAKLQIVLEKMHECNKIDTKTCEKALSQYREFLTTDLNVNASEFSNFDKRTSRLDTFLAKYLQQNKAYSELWQVVKFLLILSHGQASVERGFSINRKIEVENLKTHTYISQKIICDHINFCGGIDKIVITQELRNSVASARKKYLAYLEELRANKENEQISLKRKEYISDLDTLVTKKHKTEADIRQLEKSADDLATEGETLNDLKRFKKSNEFRKLVRAKKQELSDTQKLIDKIRVILKN